MIGGDMIAEILEEDNKELLNELRGILEIADSIPLLLDTTLNEKWLNFEGNLLDLKAKNDESLSSAEHSFYAYDSENPAYQKIGKILLNN